MIELTGIDLSESEIEEVARRTSAQRENELWLQLRQGRLTASQFGEAIDAYSNGTIDKFVKSWVGTSTQKKCKAIEYGIRNEPLVIEKYQTVTGYRVESTGLWLFPNRILGASPDGLVYCLPSDTQPSGILEVKCPYTALFRKRIKWIYDN